MEKMGTEYQIFNGKEYVSLRRFWNMEGKYKTEKAKNEELEEENKTLNIKVASLEGEIKGLNSTIEKLREENQTLELWLDNKEKLNGEYRKEIEKLKSTYVYDAKQVRDIC